MEEGRKVTRASATRRVPDALNNGQVGRVDAFIGKNGTTPIKQWEQRFTYDLTLRDLVSEIRSKI